MKNNLSDALGWKFNNEPGMTTIDGVIVEWPEKVLGPKPEGAALQAILDDYVAQGIPEMNARKFLADTDHKVARFVEDLILILDADPGVTFTKSSHVPIELRLLIKDRQAQRSKL